MRVAIYARRSTEEHQAASLEVQLEEATRFALARGWEVVETFEEDAVSRAEFVKRPALIRLLNAAREGRFVVVIMRDETRLGGDLYRTGMILQDLHDAGVKLWYYATAEAVSFDDPTSKLMQAVKLYASELERVKIASRTREHLEARARKGANVGGRVYGYDNVPVFEGERRVRVDYAINPAEAAVVLEAFQRASAGEGLRSIAHRLNLRGVPSPRAGKRGTGSWCPSVLHEMLRRERYVGVLVWGRAGSTYRGGTRVAIERPMEECTRVVREELRIIPEDLWQAVRGRAELRANITGTSRAGAPKYLLSGLARCSVCGGPMQVSNSRHGTVSLRSYLCGWARDRGPTVCVNSLRRPVDEVNETLVEWIEGNVLNDAVARAVIVEARRIHESNAVDPTAGIAPLEHELSTAEGEVARLTAAIASTSAPLETLVRALTARDARVRQLREQLSTLRAALPTPPVWVDLEGQLRARLADLRGAFKRNGQEARAVLTALLVGPIVCAPVRVSDRPRFELSGQIVVPSLDFRATVRQGASPAGSERYDGWRVPFKVRPPVAA